MGRWEIREIGHSAMGRQGAEMELGWVVVSRACRGERVRSEAGSRGLPLA